ncbi:MAG: dihydropteroate synthase [Nitrospiraceae bacterium]|nr:dihydropteroate synthase [Nitrospiraceae bacterium]
MILRAGPHLFDFSQRTFIMGILNVTPDSFSDGGLYADPSKAVDHALKMAEAGADIIDIGGESTRPGSLPVYAELEIRRTVPVIEALRKRSSLPVSIDTYRSDVARAALEAGADIINDISGMRFDSEMPGVAARYKAPVVLMHIKGTPGDMQKNPVYEALIPEIIDYLRGSIHIAMEAGVEREKLVIDPGIGFGKTVSHNLEILKNLETFTGLGLPILAGPSRKAFIGNILGGLPANERLEGTLAAISIAVMNGANIVRVHDVRQAVRAVKIADAIKRA